MFFHDNSMTNIGHMTSNVDHNRNISHKKIVLVEAIFWGKAVLASSRVMKEVQVAAAFSSQKHVNMRACQLISSETKKADPNLATMPLH